MNIPIRFFLYFLILVSMFSVGITIAVYELQSDTYFIDKNGENITMDEFIEEVNFIEDISNNFSTPETIFDNIVGIDIITYDGKDINRSQREYYVNNNMEGISMLPTLYPGTTVICIKDFTKEDLEVNNIIVFKRNNGYVIHRIVDIQNDTYITKGDNNPVTDAPVDFEDIHCLVGGIIF